MAYILGDEKDQDRSLLRVTFNERTQDFFLPGVGVEIRHGCFSVGRQSCLLLVLVELLVQAPVHCWKMSMIEASGCKGRVKQLRPLIRCVEILVIMHGVGRGRWQGIRVSLTTHIHVGLEAFRLAANMLAWGSTRSRSSWI